jgi:hypothetical protein
LLIPLLLRSLFLRKFFSIRDWIFAFALLILALPLRAQQAGGLAAAPSPVRMVRSIVGAKGEQRNGSFVMTDPRSTFYVPDDHEVIVYFE